MSKKRSNTPRHKRLNRESRLQAAPYWLPKYNGANMVRGYSIHFGVDLLCAAHELRLLGLVIEEKYIKQLETNMENRTKNKQLKKEKANLENDFEQEDNHFIVIGYTANGFPYGITLEESEIEKKQE
jgi:hypothetical protein